MRNALLPLIWTPHTLDCLFGPETPRSMRLGRKKPAKHNPPNPKRAKAKAARKQNRRSK